MSKRRITLSDLPLAVRRQIEEKTRQEEDARSRRKQALKPKAESPPHDLLWEGLSDIPGAVREYAGAVPQRKFRLDIAFPAIKLAVEIDGWQYHGKFKDAHAKDRERQNLLVMEGWQVLRFTAGQIFNEKEACLNTVLKKIVMLQAEKMKGVES